MVAFKLETKRGLVELTIRKLIILHLHRYQRLEHERFNLPFQVTQDGIAQALNKSRGHICLELKRLEDQIYFSQKNVKGARVGRLVYFLTQDGIDEYDDIRDELSDGYDLTVDRIIDELNSDIDITKSKSTSNAYECVLIALEELSDKVKINRKIVISNLARAINALASEEFHE